MSIYFGFKPSPGQAIAPNLSARDINLLRASPSAVRSIAIADEPQPGYSIYLSCLPAFLLAFITQASVSLRQLAYRLTVPNDFTTLPIQAPPLILKFARAVPQQALDLMAQAGYSTVQDKTKKMAYIVNEPTPQLLRQLLTYTPEETTPSTVNTTNLKDLRSWYIVVKILSVFLCAHTYPAFSEPSQDERAPIAPLTMRKRPADDPNAPTTSKRIAMDTDVMEEGDETIDIEEEFNSTPVKDIIQLKRAKPPRNDLKGWGFTDTVPNGFGLFFAYVPDLAMFDTDTVPSLIETYFVRSLGQNADEMSKNLQTIRSAWGNIGRSDAGNKLAHMCKVIDLSIRAQARAYPIFSTTGVYEGTVMSGARYTICVKDVMYKPMSYHDLQAVVLRSSHHTYSLSCIAGLFQDDESKDLILKCTSMRSLSKILTASFLDEISRDRARRYAANLSFMQRHWALNSSTVERALTLIKDESIDISDEPLHHSVIFDNRRVAQVLGAFGYNAFSFLIPSTKAIPVKHKDAPNTFVVRQIPLQSAIQDMLYVIEHKAITNDPSNLSKVHIDRSIVGADKGKVWAALQKLVDAQVVVGSETMVDVVGQSGSSAVVGDLFDF